MAMMHKCFECGVKEEGLERCKLNPRHWFHKGTHCEAEHIPWCEDREQPREQGHADANQQSLSEEDTDTLADRFAYEQDLRDYLAKNPGVIEPEMSLWPVGESESAIEFRVDSGRRIDILAKDRNGVPVVIELKVGSGHERVIGQALYYRGCVKESLAAQKVRIIIIAREITPEIRIATTDLPDVDLFEYRLSVSLNKVSRA